MRIATLTRGPRDRWMLAAAVLTWLLLCLPPVVGQTNSLLGARATRGATAPQVPTTQPVGAAFGIRTAVQDEQPRPQANATLLSTSPIAVEPPAPETIGLHDLVTIIVRVSKTAKADSKLESKKDWSHNWELSKWIKWSDLHGLVPALLEHGNPAVEFEAQDDWGGDGKYDRKDELTTRIQAEVIDVKPNGTIVVEARNDVAYGEEAYTITLTGVCRSEDVTPQNTVLSSQIANLRVDVRDRGAVRDASRRGWLKRGVDWLRPF